MSGAAPDQLMLDPYVEALARAPCQEAGHDPDEIGPIADADVIVDGVRQPAEMTGAAVDGPCRRGGGAARQN